MAVTQVDGARQLRFTGNLDMTTNKIVNLTNPTANQDAATKAYVDAQVAGGVVDLKESVRVATTTNGTFASAFAAGQTVDGITLVASDRILLKNQSTGSQNGIYDVTASGAPVRSSDANSSAEVTPGMFTFIEEGTANADTGWLLTTTGTITLDTTSLTFEKFSQTGQLLSDLTAGDGLTKTGETINLVGASSGGITVNPDDVEINLDTNSGLGLAAGGISVGAGAGLLNTANEVDVVGKVSGGLDVDDNDIAILLDTNSGLNLGVNGISVGDGAGLVATGGTLDVVGGDGIDAGADNITIDLDGTTLSKAVAGVSLADGASASLLVGQGASDSTYNAVSGDMTMDASANFTIENSYVTDTWVTRETPTGTVNGSNTDFTMAATPLSNTDCIYLNGVLQNAGGANDYTLSGAVITFNTAPESGDVILVNYNQ